MPEKLKIFALSGSTRQNSSNHNLIKAIGKLTTVLFAIDMFEGLAELPHFNPDKDGDAVDPKITSFRNRLREADAILICTPEYAVGVPGSLKNAIDWTVSSMEFSHKPVALITASTSGQFSHPSLMATLLIIESKITERSQLVIPAIKTKVNDEGIITDAPTLNKINELIASLIKMVRDPASEEYLPPPQFKI
ncbi:MAG: NADPH-dependent FMN reductase [Flavitalea sp.]